MLDEQSNVKEIQFSGEPTWRTYTKAFIITMVNDHASTVGARKCIQSIKNTKSLIHPYIQPATTPSDLKAHLAPFKYTLDDWKYPKTYGEVKHDFKTGLKLTGYRANDYTKVVSCLVSHMRLWQISIDLNEPIIILEHDALFTKKFDIRTAVAYETFTGGVLGLNDPRGATRKSAVYHNEIVSKAIEKNFNAIEAPWVDDKTVPQGIAGNSAYLIKPEGAYYLLEKIKEIGLWPNDALMCKQLFPWLQQAYPYYTTVQGTPSTTTS